MLGTVISAIAAFAATNVDDIFLLMLYFGQAEGRKYRRSIVFGQYLGICVLILVSVLGGAALYLLPEGILGFLGLIPIALGIRVWIISCHSQQQTKKESISNLSEHEQDAGSKQEAAMAKALSVALVTVSNGGDNLGVYAPLFAGASVPELAVMIGVFLILVAVWCLLGQQLSRLPVVHRWIGQYQEILVPVVLVGLGVYILVGGFL